MQDFTNPNTGELFYEPIRLHPIHLSRRILAWIRIWGWGFCPNCNSDAPKIDNCKVCEWDTNSPFNLSKRIEYWNKWKFFDWHDGIYK